jgi:hypothetical protein
MATTLTTAQDAGRTTLSRKLAKSAYTAGLVRQRIRP